MNPAQLAIWEVAPPVLDYPAERSMPVARRRTQVRAPIAHQIAVWEALPSSPGRPSIRIWGCPARVWDAARKVAERAGRSFDVSAIEAVVPREVERVRRTPYWRKRNVVEPKEVLRMIEIETVAVPADRTSDAMRRMVVEGRLPGMKWDPERGVVKVTQRARYMAGKA